MARIFDIENKKDYTDLWDILSEEVVRVVKQAYGPSFKYYGIDDNVISITSIIKINWHDKTEIIRPIKEATEADIGKLCKFWDSNPDCYSFGIMTKISYSENAYYKDGWTLHKHCRRLTKQEIEELC